MAKKPKKAKTNKARKVVVTGNADYQAGELDVKLYQLNETLATPFMRGGEFSFRVAFDRDEGGGKFKQFNKNRCPVITVLPTDVLQTENETAQRMIEHFTVPTNTKRNGNSRPAGNLFIDVTETETEYDIDLDEIFDAVE